LRYINVIMKLLCILTLIILYCHNVFSVDKPDFAKMMEQRREQIKEMRKNDIPIDRTIRYSERYGIYK